MPSSPVALLKPLPLYHCSQPAVKSPSARERMSMSSTERGESYRRRTIWCIFDDRTGVIESKIVSTLRVRHRMGESLLLSVCFTLGQVDITFWTSLSFHHAQRSGILL